MPTLNYSTNIPAGRTVGEVQAMLAAHGADAVAVKYADKQPVGVSFILLTPHGERTFDLPVNVAGVQRLLAEQQRAGQLRKNMAKAAVTSPEHAARVAWRVLKDWLEAQLTLIDAQMATLDQVMLPYLRVGRGTLYEVYCQGEQQAIAAAGA